MSTLSDSPDFHREFGDHDLPSDSTHSAVKILVHNVSHTDLCLTIRLSPPDPHGNKTKSKSNSSINKPSYIGQEMMARPRSSHFNPLCSQLLSALRNKRRVEGIWYPDKHQWKRYVGFTFIPPYPLEKSSLKNFRLREPYTLPSSLRRGSCKVTVVKVFFPLIAVLLPKWISLHNRATPYVLLHVQCSLPSIYNASHARHACDRYRMTQSLHPITKQKTKHAATLISSPIHQYPSSQPKNKEKDIPIPSYLCRGTPQQTSNTKFIRRVIANLKNRTSTSKR